MTDDINKAMDTDKIKVFGARIKVDGTSKLAELERAERVRPIHPLLYECTLTIFFSDIGKNESQSRCNSLTRDNVFCQSPAHIQLPRIPSRRTRNHVH